MGLSFEFLMFHVKTKTRDGIRRANENNLRFVFRVSHVENHDASIAQCLVGQAGEISKFKLSSSGCSFRNISSCRLFTFSLAGKSASETAEGRALMQNGSDQTLD